MTTLAEQFQDFAECCLSLARTAKTAAGRARFLQMAHEYRLATLRVLQEELSSDQKVGNADLTHQLAEPFRSPRELWITRTRLRSVIFGRMISTPATRPRRC